MVLVGLIWNEARKEIVFLCLNFGLGTTEQSVVRQLDTGNFLRYQVSALSERSRITVDSAYNLGLYRCIVELDPDQQVIRATLE